MDAPRNRSVSVKKALAHLRAADPVLDSLIARVGPYKMQYAPPVFENLVRSIIYQQLNGRAAATIFDRFSSACGEVTPENVLRLRPSRLRAAGLSERKMEYVRDLARQTRDGAVDFAAFPAMDDDTIIAALTEVRGIGVWTVHMFLMFALRRPDVLPVGDYGIRTAIKKLYALPELPKPSEMERIAAPWRPYCSVACWYLWRSLEGPATV